MARDVYDEMDALNISDAGTESGDDVTAGDMAYFAASVAPGTGEAISAKEGIEAYQEGDYVGAALGAAGAVPGVGIVGRMLKKGVDGFRKLNKVDESVDTLSSVGIKEDELAKLKELNKKPNKAVLKRHDNMQQAAEQLEAGELPVEDFRKIADETKPVSVWENMPDMATPKQISIALASNKLKNGILGVNRNIEEGKRITSRLDIPAYSDYDTWIVTLKGTDKGDKNLYAPAVALKNVDLSQSENLQGKALKVAKGGPKGPFAVMEGDYVDADPEDIYKAAEEALKDTDNWTQVGYDPTRRGYFYDRRTMEPVLSADELLQVGPLVLAKNAQKTTQEAMKFNEGGFVTEEDKQEAPIGALNEEVADDIPARLSEGEFVLPADVVRYIGLDKLMKMRQQAKAGLQKMEEMGQLSNPDEATIPDDAPFEPSQTEMAFNRGGFVQPRSMYNMSSKQNPTINFTQAPASKAPAAGGYAMKKFIGPDGTVAYIPFINGVPQMPIPEGYEEVNRATGKKVKDETAKKTPDVTPAPVDNTGTSGPVDSGSDDSGSDGGDGGSSGSGGGTIGGLPRGDAQYQIGGPDVTASGGYYETNPITGRETFVSSKVGEDALDKALNDFIKKNPALAREAKNKLADKQDKMGMGLLTKLATGKAALGPFGLGLMGLQAYTDYKRTQEQIKADVLSNYFGDPEKEGAGSEFLEFVYDNYGVSEANNILTGYQNYIKEKDPNADAFLAKQADMFAKIAQESDERRKKREAELERRMAEIEAEKALEAERKRREAEAEEARKKAKQEEIAKLIRGDDDNSDAAKNNPAYVPPSQQSKTSPRPSGAQPVRRQEEDNSDSNRGGGTPVSEIQGTTDYASAGGSQTVGTGGGNASRGYSYGGWKKGGLIKKRK